MKTIPPPRFEGTFRLPDGRKLGYAEYGPANGKPILWFHGTPGARRQIAPQARVLAERRRVRLIAIERPGIGDSTSHSYGSLADWAADIRAFCDAKGIDHFAVCGLSGGGPYALACAFYLQGRVVAATILGGVAPAAGADAAEGGISNLARRFSPLAKHLRVPVNRLMLRLIRRLEPHAGKAVAVFARFMPPGDKAMFEDPALQAVLTDDLMLGSKQQMQAMIHDAVMFGKDWGFPLSKIETPVYLLYGNADNIVPVEHGKHMARRIPKAVFREREGEGHMGGLGASEEIFNDLLSHWPRAKAKTKAKAKAKAKAKTKK